MENRIRETGENIKNSAFFKGTVTRNRPLKELTTMKVGGSAALFIEPSDSDSAAEAFRIASKNGVDVFTLGGGSNLIISDQGFDCAVLTTTSITGISLAVSSDHTSAALADGKTVTGTKAVLTCGAGNTIGSLNRFCEENCLLGLETFSGLPGTAGGACYMNARCYEKNISDVLNSVQYLDLTDSSNPVKKTLSAEQTKEQWAYKKSPFQTVKSLVVQASFNVILVEEEYRPYIKQQNEKYKADREAKGHFRFPSAGSVFKNNHDFGRPSGVIIDQAGLKGTKIGGAQVAPWHGNFIINTGNATARDIKQLVELVQEKVKAATGFQIENEVIFCGKGFENQ